MQYYDTKYTKELIKLEKKLGKEAGELNRVLKEIDDLQKEIDDLQKEESVVFKELNGKRKWEWSDAEQFPTKLSVGFSIIPIIIVCYFMINHPMYIFHAFLVLFIIEIIVAIFTGIGYQIFVRSMCEGETKRLKGLEKREKEIRNKLGSLGELKYELEKLKPELELEVINNKANADLEKLEYDKKKYEDIFKFLRSRVDASIADARVYNNRFMAGQRFGYTVLNTGIIYVKDLDLWIDYDREINPSQEEKYSFYNNGYQYLRNVSECSMLSVILRKEIDEYIRKKYADELAQFKIDVYRRNIETYKTFEKYKTYETARLVYDDFVCDASGKISVSGEGFYPIIVMFSIIRLNKAYKDQSTMKPMF